MTNITFYKVFRSVERGFKECIEYFSDEWASMEREKMNTVIREIVTSIDVVKRANLAVKELNAATGNVSIMLLWKALEKAFTCHKIGNITENFISIMDNYGSEKFTINQIVDRSLYVFIVNTTDEWVSNAPPGWEILQ